MIADDFPWPCPTCERIVHTKFCVDCDEDLCSLPEGELGESGA